MDGEVLVGLLHSVRGLLRAPIARTAVATVTVAAVAADPPAASPVRELVL